MNASVVDVREWQRLDKGSECAPDEQLGRFERLLADLSATFINVPSEQVNGMLQDALGRVVECTRSGPEHPVGCRGRRSVRHHDWTRLASGGRMASAPARVSARELLPWSLEKANAGELVQFSSVDEVPNEVDRATYRRFGTKSTVAVPLRVGGRSLGVVAFGAVEQRAVVAVSDREPPAARREHLCGPAGPPPVGRIAAHRSGPGLATEGRAQAEDVPLPRESRSGAPRASSSATVPPCAASRSRCGRSRRPIRRCCCSARPAPARRCSRPRSTS